MIKKRLLKLFILSFFQVFFCQKSIALEGYCFPASTSLKAVKNYTSTVLTSNDKVYERASRNCLEFEVSPGRQELIRKWIQQKYRIVRTYSEGEGSSSFVEASTVTQNCRLKIERISKGKTTKTNAAVGSRNSLNQQQINSQGTRTSNMLLGKGFNGSLRVGLETVFLTCLGASGSIYQVSVSLDSPTSSLSTSIQVTPGAKVNIGQIVENLNEKRRTLGVSVGAQIEKTEGTTTHDYFLMAQ